MIPAHEHLTCKAQVIHNNTVPGQDQLTIDQTLVSAMNKWRADQNPSMIPGEAILVLLRRSLASQGYLDGGAADDVAQDTDTLAQAFRNFIQSKDEAQRTFE